MELGSVTAWGWFWLSWALTGFAVEVYWLIANSANTLSRQIWGIEKLDLAHPLDFAEWTPLHWILSICMVLFFGWLCVHFPFGYLRTVKK